jgi:hypothetical protein
MYWVDANYDGKVDNYCHKIRWGEGEISVAAVEVHARLSCKLLSAADGKRLPLIECCCNRQPHFIMRAWLLPVGIHAVYHMYSSLHMSLCAHIPSGCPKINKLAIDRFRFGLQWCMAKAVELGLDIAITPHLDDGLEMGEQTVVRLYQ